MTTLATLAAQIKDLQTQLAAANADIATLKAAASVFQVAHWSSLNPDLAGIAGTDPAAGAAVVIVTSLAAVGETMMIQLNFVGDVGGVDFTHVVQAGDTTTSVAQDLASQINANTTCMHANITGEWTPGTNQLGVTNYADNLVTVSGQRHAECFSIQQGSPALDAGPILFLNRLPINPKTGQPFTPPNGSNIGQITFGSCRADNPGVPSTEYGVIACNMLNNDPNNLSAEIAFYIVATANGTQTLLKIASIGNSGVYVGDRKL